MQTLVQCPLFSVLRPNKKKSILNVQCQNLHMQQWPKKQNYENHWGEFAIFTGASQIGKFYVYIGNIKQTEP